MKYVTAMMMLATLVSCNSGGGGSNKPGRIVTALSSVPRGLVIAEKHTGQIHDFNVAEDGSLTVGVKANNYVTTEVVLKMEGNLVYKYETSNEAGEEGRKTVTLSKMPSQADLDEFLARPDSRVVNDIATVTFTSTEEWNPTDGSTVSSKYTVNARVNLKNVHCDSSASTAVSDSFLTQNGTRTRMPSVSSSSVTSCPEILSMEALKAIDLSSVTYCDQTVQDDDNSVTCESNKDMSFLTSDL